MKSDTFKVIFSGFDEDFHLSALEKLQREHGWTPVYFIGNPSNESTYVQKFPEAIFHRDQDAFRGLAPERFRSTSSSPLDRDILVALTRYHHVAITMMDRMDPGTNFSYRERVEHFYALASYWLTVVEHLRPELVVFHLTPHLVYDFMLYVICQIKGIRTVLLNPISVDGMFYVSHQYNGPTPIEESYQMLLSKAITGQPLSERVRAYVSRVRGNYTQALPAYAVENNSKEKRLSHQSRHLKAFKESLMTLVQGGKAKPFRATYLKRANRSIQDGGWTVGEYKNYKNSANTRKRMLHAHYQKISQKFDPSRKFVYVPLQYQPEKTTSPEADLFVDQYLMVDLLAKSIPKDWLIYIKEHPTQFYESWHGERSAKDETYYAKLLAHPNVRLIELSASSFDLIDKSVACATTTGTTGWEALLRGKPVFLFGYPWYRGCEGIFAIHNRADCVEAVKSIESGHCVNLEKVEVFLGAIDQACYTGYIYGRMKNSARIDDRDNVGHIVEALTKAAKGILHV